MDRVRSHATRACQRSTRQVQDLGAGRGERCAQVQRAIVDVGGAAIHIGTGTTNVDIPDDLDRPNSRKGDAPAQVMRAAQL